MTRLQGVLLVSATVLGAGSWYFFRPERAIIDAHVHEQAPVETAAVLLEGRFAPKAHQGRGTAQLIQLSSGQRVLRFTGFETSNGPDVRVYLLGSTDARTKKDLETAGFLDLGALKGNIGDQNYDIPDGADVGRYRSVSIWCRRFAVNFAVAVLAPPQASP